MRSDEGQQDAREPRIKLEKASKSYHMGQIEVVALREVTLEVMPGEFIVFLGPSGSGKTTLLNLIGGLDSPSSGRIVVNGIDITQLTASQLTGFRRSQVGFIFQFFNLIPTLTARENVEFAAELVTHRRLPEEILREVGLGDRMNHFPSELSGGENQRVAIARALATDPSVILCDEPTGSLDFETGKRIFKLLRVLNEEKLKTVVMVTHNSAIGDITLENLAIGCLGVIMGMPLGHYLAVAYMAQFETDIMSMSAVIFPRSYAIAASAALVILLVSQIPAIRQIYQLSLPTATKDWSE